MSPDEEAQQDGRAKDGDALPTAPQRERDEVPPFVWELIRLRDQVRIAEPSAANLRVFDTKLGRILEKEGVRSLEESGMFDPERHEVNATTPTNDIVKDGVIASTVLPGYLCGECVLRAQQVILYAFSGSRERGDQREQAAEVDVP